MSDPAEAHANPLRLDRRADWNSTGASPIGLALRGQLEPGDTEAFWLYDALGPRIWVHHDNERSPDRPLIFVLEASEQQVTQRRRRFTTSQPVVNRLRGELSQVRVRGPVAPELPLCTGPRIVYEPGPHALELVASQEATFGRSVTA